MKTNLKGLLPPLCSKWYRNYLYQKGIKNGTLAAITGDYTSFEEAAQDSGTYDDELYAEKVLQTYRDVHGKQSWPMETHDWRLLSKVSLGMGQEGGLRVLDIGGSSGDYFFKLKSFLGKEAIKSWIIVEAKKVVDKMRGIDPFLKYVSSMDDIDRENLDINFVFISGTLQYLEKPFQILESLIPLRADFICINKSILWDRPTKIMKQITPDAMRSSRPIWIFNEAAIKDKLSTLSYRLLWAYDNSELVTYIPGCGSLVYRGLFFRRNEKVDSK